MKKMMMLMVLFFCQFMHAAEHRGQIINLLSVDEGMKVILNEKSKIVSLYLSKDSENFLQLSLTAQNIKSKNLTAVISTDLSSLGRIIKIEETK